MKGEIIISPLNPLQNLALSNLYTALILGGTHQNIEKNYSLKLPKEKRSVLHKYITRNNLEHIFIYKELDNDNLEILGNTLFYSLESEWKNRNQKNIQFISPSQLNVNVFNLWVTLFGEKKNKRIYIPSKHYEEDARTTLTLLFEEVMKISLVENSLTFTITNYKDWFIHVYEYKRPLYEVNMLINFAEPVEVQKLIASRVQFDIDRGVQYI